MNRLWNRLFCIAAAMFLVGLLMCMWGIAIAIVVWQQPPVVISIGLILFQAGFTVVAIIAYGNMIRLEWSGA